MSKMKSSSQQRAAAADLAAKQLLIKAVDKCGKKVAAVGEMELCETPNSRMLNVLAQNGNAEFRTLVFGTPLAVAGENTAIPFNSNIVNHYLDNLADITDNQGVGANFIQEINRRLLRHAVVVSHLEIITPNTSLGNSQKAEPINRVLIPFNSASDVSQKTGAFIPQFTEYTGVEALSHCIVLGDFSGFTYRLLGNSQVQMNFYLKAIDMPVFKY